MRPPIVDRLWWLGFLGFLHRVDESLAWTRILLLLFFAPVLTDLVRFLRRASRPKERSERGEAAPPALGTAVRGGPLLFQLRYLLANLLTLLNPHGFRQVLRQVRGESRARKRVGERVPTTDDFEQEVEYTLPFVGEWMIGRGGITPESSHSWEILSQRYAYDFVVVDSSGRTHRGYGSRLEDYHAYGQQILAPADGVVVEVVDGVRDAPSVGTGWVDWRAPRIGGNSVTIRHAEKEFSHLAHLIPGSVRVHVGQRVRRGEVVGRCGHSGHSTEPHLHFQVQDHPDFYQAVGLPVRFSGVAVNGGEDVDGVYLRGGMRVREAAKNGFPLFRE